MKPTFISNRKLTLLRKLQRKKYRKKEELFLAEGARAVQQIVENKRVSIRGLYFDESQHYWEKNPWESFVESINSSIVEKKDYADVSDTDHPQGAIALCCIPEEAAVQNLANKEGVIIASDGIQDPGNLGTIIRTASWFGVLGFLSGKGTVGLFHPKVVRATAGATGVLPHANVKLSESLSFFENRGWHILLLDAGEDSLPLKELEKREKTIIVIGNEAYGVDSSLCVQPRTKVRIASPQNSGVESLNAGVAASIALYEFY
jgi:TrmH family RNA methyltransferase